MAIAPPSVEVSPLPPGCLYIVGELGHRHIYVVIG